jgi:bifunctional non-homologous end joining protein LigD
MGVTPASISGDVARLPTFVVQKHWARQLHYDFRLEISRRLVSWAIPKGPSLDPQVRRLAIRMPDHPLSYTTFEGTIPAHEYGAGVVMVWDTGTYEPLLPVGVGIEEWLAREHLRFILHGAKLGGRWEMIRYRTAAAKDEAWLLVKLRDRFARPGFDPEALPASALTGRVREEIARTGMSLAVERGPRPIEDWAFACAATAFDASG